MLGVDLQMATDDDLGQAEPSPSRRPESKAEKNAEEKKPEPEAEPEPEDEDAREKKRRKAEAVKAKEEGNAAYKKKDFDAAIEQYTKAMELDEDDIAYRTNRAAVYLEMGKVRLTGRALMTRSVCVPRLRCWLPLFSCGFAKAGLRCP